MRKVISAAVVLAMVLCAANAYAHKEAREMKKGILLVAFGTSEASAKVSFQNIEAKVKKVFPGVDVVWAYRLIPIPLAFQQVPPLGLV